jgi:hypothetical protein
MLLIFIFILFPIFIFIYPNYPIVGEDVEYYIYANGSSKLFIFDEDNGVVIIIGDDVDVDIDVKLNELNAS